MRASVDASGRAAGLEPEEQPLSRASDAARAQQSEAQKEAMGKVRLFGGMASTMA
jgi:hypothetical protein